MMLQQLWNDESGAVFTTELLMVTSVMVAGLATGLTKVRDTITNEMDEVATSISNLNQSYLYSGVGSHSAVTSGSGYVDMGDARSASSVCIQQYFGD